MSVLVPLHIDRLFCRMKSTKVVLVSRYPHLTTQPYPPQWFSCLPLVPSWLNWLSPLMNPIDPPPPPPSSSPLKFRSRVHHLPCDWWSPLSSAGLPVRQIILLTGPSLLSPARSFSPSLITHCRVSRIQSKRVRCSMGIRILAKHFNKKLSNS